MSQVLFTNNVVQIEDKRSEVLKELAKAIQAVAAAVQEDRRAVTGVIIYPSKED